MCLCPSLAGSLVGSFALAPPTAAPALYPHRVTQRLSGTTGRPGHAPQATASCLRRPSPSRLCSPPPLSSRLLAPASAWRGSGTPSHEARLMTMRVAWYVWDAFRDLGVRPVAGVECARCPPRVSRSPGGMTLWIASQHGIGADRICLATSACVSVSYACPVVCVSGDLLPDADCVVLRPLVGCLLSFVLICLDSRSSRAAARRRGSPPRA